LRETLGQGQGAQDGGLHEVGPDRRTGPREGPELRAAPRGSGQAGAGRAGKDPGPVKMAAVPSRPRRSNLSDTLFRIATGAIAALVILTVVGIGVVLINDSTLSIRKFGLRFWLTRTWDPVAGDFGALPFIWGTMYSSVLALVIATPVALGIAIFLAE